MTEDPSGKRTRDALDFVLEATTTGLWTWDITTDQVWWSQEVGRIHGLEPHEFARTGDAFFNLVHPQDRERVQLSVLTAIRERRLYSEEFRILRPDGSIRWVTNRGRATFDDGGEPASVLGTITDITDTHAYARQLAEERLVTERELLASEERRLLAMQAGRMATWDFDVETGCNHWDTRLFDLLGQSLVHQHHASQTWLNVLHPNDRERVAAEFEFALQGQTPFDTCFRVIRADGEMGWFKSVAKSVVDEHGKVVSLAGLVQDITDQMQTELELVLANERLREATLAGRLGIHEYDPTTNRLIWDAQMRTWWGLTAHEEPTYDKFVDRLHPDDRSSMQAAVDLALNPNSDGRYDAEYRVIHPDGTQRWVRATGLVSFADGRAVRLVGTVQDVTRERDSQEALRLSARRLEVALKCSSVALFQQDIELRYTWICNPKLGFDASDVIGKQDHDLFERAEDAEVIESVKRDVIRSGIGQQRQIVIHHQGAVKHFRLLVEPLQSAAGDRIGVTGAAIDITELKQAEEEIARNQHELKTLTNNTPDILTRFDRQLRHVFVNAAVERATGRAATEFIGKTNREVGMPVELCDMWDAALRNVLETGQTVSREFSYETDRGLRHFNAVLVPERGPSGEIDHVLGVTRDRTEEKVAQDALRVADQRKDEFLATLAHELRNPLAPVRTGLQILRLSKDQDVVQRTKVMMERQLGHMIRLVDDLLEVSRITSGKIVLRLDRIELQSAIQTAIESARPLIDAARHVLELEVPSEPIWLQADATRICQIVGNLLTNAAKYSHDGKRIRLRVHLEGDVAVIAVSDEGEGIPQSMLTQVFEMFTQGKRTLERAQGGLGIGLALVKGLAEKHGGSVTVESAGLGAGSTFTVRLPALTDAEWVYKDVAPLDRLMTSASIRILLVDDNTDAADALAELLSIYGHEIRVVNSGAAALEAASEFKPGLVLLDIGMPGMDGYETAKRIRASDSSGSLVLAALTGWGAEADRSKATKAGFDHHFTKPVELEKLQGILQLTALRQANSASSGSPRS